MLQCRNSHGNFIHGPLDPQHYCIFEDVMLRYHNRPPRRLRPKPEAKVATRPAPKWWQVRADSRQNLIMMLVAVVTLVRFVSAAIANPAPVAVPGDIVPLGTARSMTPYETIQVRALATPWAKPGAACTLDVARMAHEGGAFSVLAVRNDGVMVSWAGGPTAAPAEACQPGPGGLLVPTADYSGLLVRPMPRR
jgi:hypothetical protein